MFLRALFAFLALPGVFAFLVPLLVTRALGEPAHPGIAAIAVVLAGIAGLLWCVWSFYTTGKGTLAPWSPPQHLVTHGLYRFSRNPMYCSVLLLVSGWALLFQSTTLAAYTAALAVGFHVRVVFGEEPWLAEKFGEQWHQYSHRVNRWAGRASRHPLSDA